VKGRDKMNTQQKQDKERNPLSPRNDHFFKRLFADENDHEILISFLRSVLDIPEDEYDEIYILDPNTTVEHTDDKYNILDVKLKTKSGQIIDIEIQLLSEISDNSCYPDSFVIRTESQTPEVRPS
jgi:hypothetical protein